MKANKQFIIDRLNSSPTNRLKNIFGRLDNVNDLTDKMITDFLDENFSKIFQQ